MKTRITAKILMTLFFMVCLPFLAIELLIRKPGRIIEQIKLSFQLMLYVIGLAHPHSK